MIIAFLPTSVAMALATILILGPNTVWAFAAAPVLGSLAAVLQGIVVACLRQRRIENLDVLADDMVEELNRVVAASSRTPGKEAAASGLRRTG
jgi:hypothetical protein